MSQDNNIIDIFQSDLRPMEFWHLQASKRLDVWRKGEAYGYKTGFQELDKMIRLRPGELITIGAQSSMGKTSLAMQMAENVAIQIQEADELGCVAIFSAEMSGEALYIRMASALCGVNAHKVAMGKADVEEIQDLSDAMERIRSLPIWIDDCSGPTTAQMLTQLSKLNESMPVKMLVFDYMELSGDEDRNEEKRISNISKNLAAIAKTLMIPVIAISQVNDESEKRANKIPSMHDLRYSRATGQRSDVVLLIMRWDYYIERGLVTPDQLDKLGVPEADRKGVAFVVIGKQRNGPTGIRKLAFLKEQSKFADLHSPLGATA